MKFNLATLYKVPFDNSYRDVVDYYALTDTSATPTKRVFGKDPLTSASIKNARGKFFATKLDSRVVYTSNSAYKSVKVIGNSIECSVVGDYNDICDFNYIVFSDTISNPEKQLYCFVTNITSNNDNTVTKSCMITCEIDFWTNYVDSIEMSTRKQFETFAHEKTDIFNGKYDSRLSDDFTYVNYKTNMFNNIIMFLRVKADYRWLSSRGLLGGYGLEAYACGYGVYYVPFCYYHNSKFYIIKGVKDSNGNTWSPLYDWINLLGLDSEYVFDVSITPFTPFGTFGSSYLTVYNNDYYLSVTGVTTSGDVCYTSWIDANDSGNYFSIEFKYENSSFTFPPVIYTSNKHKFIPDDNNITQYRIDVTYTKNKNINSNYVQGNEIKLYQPPYRKYVMMFNGVQYDVSPTPTGTTVSPFIVLELKRLTSMSLSTINNNDISTIRFLSLNDGASLPSAKDKLLAYKEQAMEADKTKLTVAQLGAIASMTVGFATGNVLVGVGGAAALASSSASYQANKIRAKNAPDNINVASNDCYDVMNTASPILITKTLYKEDYDAVCSIWQHFGYPIHEERDFSVKRFYYDYKQIKNPIFPNITNPLARKKIEQIFANGVTIWHYNRLDRDHDYFQFGNYSINNPDWDGAEEEIQ